MSSFELTHSNWVIIMLNLSPSLMCADYGHFADEIDNLENAGVTSFHIDIMDGIFVPKFALSWGQVAYCRTHTKLPLEAHLMVENIEPHINFILKCGVNLVYVHVENEKAVRAIDSLKGRGIIMWGLLSILRHQLTSSSIYCRKLIKFLLCVCALALRDRGL